MADQKKKKPKQNQNKTKVKPNDNVNDNKKENIKRKKFFEKKELNDIFLEYLDLRKKMKLVNTDRAIKLLLNKLEPYDDDKKYKMIEQAIEHSWKSIYELKGKQQNDDEVKLTKVGNGAFIIGG